MGWKVDDDRWLGLSEHVLACQGLGFDWTRSGLVVQFHAVLLIPNLKPLLALPVHVLLATARLKHVLVSDIVKVRTSWVLS